MSQVIIIGLDIAKHVLHAHGADERGRVIFSERITRGKLLAKGARRRATLMGANAPAAASVKLIHQAEPKEHETSTQHLRRVFDNVMGITARERDLTDRHGLEGDNSPELLAELNDLRTAREQARAARRSAEP